MTGGTSSWRGGAATNPARHRFARLYVAPTMTIASVIADQKADIAVHNLTLKRARSPQRDVSGRQSYRHDPAAMQPPTTWVGMLRLPRFARRSQPRQPAGTSATIRSGAHADAGDLRPSGPARALSVTRRTSLLAGAWLLWRGTRVTGCRSWSSGACSASAARAADAWSGPRAGRQVTAVASVPVRRCVSSSGRCGR